MAEFLQQFISSRSREGLARMKDPHAVFLHQGPSSPNRTQRDRLSGTFHLQGIAWFQAKLFPHRLWNHDPPGFINREMSSHNGILHWVNPIHDAIAWIKGSES